jgi:YbbR domain-containing protein
MDKWLNNSSAIRVVSVLLALVIWAIVHLDSTSSPQTVTSNTDTKVIEAIPITPIGLDGERYVLTAMEPTVARVVVEGRISSLMTASNSDYVVELDLSNVKAGIQELPLKVSLPNGVSIVELSPRVITVQIEELETRTVEVEIVTVGEPAKDYIIGESKFMSEVGNIVEITMPQDDFSLLSKVAVTVDVSNAKTNVEIKKAKVEAIDIQGNVLPNATFNPETLSVMTEVSLPSKDVPVRLRYNGQLPNNMSVSTIKSKVDTVKVYGTQAQLDAIDVFDGAVVDLTRVTQSGEVMVKLSEVEGIAKVEPAEIPVEVIVEESQEKIIENVPITVTGLQEGHKVIINEAPDLKLNVPIKGTSSVVSRVRSTDIMLTLDVTNLAEGQHTVSLIAELPAYVVTNLSANFNYVVTVNIVPETAVDIDSGDGSVETIETEVEGETTSNE